jgi:hypothetical protein
MAGVAYHWRAATYVPNRLRPISAPKAGEIAEVSSVEVLGKASRRQPEETGSSRGAAIYASTFPKMRLSSPNIRLKI